MQILKLVGSWLGFQLGVFGFPGLSNCQPWPLRHTGYTIPFIKGTVQFKIKGGLIERVLDTDSNEPSLAFIRELELSQKDDTRRHDTTSLDN